MTYTLWPGSTAARDAGCTCPVMDNGRGDVALARDRGGWWQVSDCPVHGERPAPIPPRGLGLALEEPDALCPCGHRSDHVDEICAAKLSTFPEGGFMGVCPCTPDWLESEAERV